MNFDIDIKGATVKYGKTDALTNIDLQLESGKIYGLIGRNGAGKSTLLSLLASFLEPDEGTIKIGGNEPFENPDIMSQITFVYNTDYSDETEKVKGMLEVCERYRPTFNKELADDLVRLFNIPLNKQIKHLSTGMQSALNVTMGLASRSPITIFDEAYNGMDAPTRELFYKKVLEDYEECPRTIILSTHLVSEMDYLFEEAIFLHNGKVLLKEPVDVLMERGASVTGSIEEVDAFVNGMKQLSSQQLGGTKSTVVYGEISEENRHEARNSGLEVGSISLQDLFIHLTGEEVNENEK
jgi:ABC-2 type transport system ATP-binding protein